jgi:hypothetical protein
MESRNGAIKKFKAIEESDERIVKINGAEAMRR